VLAVFLGGALGTLARLTLGLWFAPDTFISPWIINIVGSFVLGLLVSTMWTRDLTPEWVKAGLGTGLLGGFTTFSAITLALAGAVTQPGSGAVMVTTVFVVFALDLLLGLVAAWFGLALGTQIAKRFDLPSVDAISDEGVDL
jgi:CrcB protein